MRTKTKNIVCIVFGIVFLFCFFSFAMMSRSVHNADAETNYFYRNDGSYNVSFAKPTDFGVHYTSSNPEQPPEGKYLEKPRYYTNEYGIGNTYSSDGHTVRLDSWGSYISKAVNLTFANSLDITNVKSMTLSLNYDKWYRTSLIQDSSCEWFTLYGVNSDGSIANGGVGFELTNENVPAPGDFSIVLNHDELSRIASDAGILQTIQWNWWNDKAPDNHAVFLTLYSITYENYEESSFGAVNATLHDSLDMNFYVSKADCSNLKVKVTFNGEETEITDYITSGSYCVFTFPNIAPQQASDSITAELYGTINGNESVRDTVETSIRSYCESLLAKSAGDLGYTSEQYNALKTLVVDLLTYCDAAQVYRDYKTDDLATKNLSEEVKELKSTYVHPASSKVSKSGELNENYRWAEAGVRYSSNFGLYFTVGAIGGSNLSIKVTNADVTTEIAECVKVGTKDDLGLYRFYYQGLSLTSFDNELTVQIFVNGEQVGQTLTYSFDSNVYALATDSSAYSILLQRAYCYGLQAEVFAESLAG